MFRKLLPTLSWSFPIVFLIVIIWQGRRILLKTPEIAAVIKSEGDR